MERLEITSVPLEQMQSASEYDIVFVVDNSSSMHKKVTHPKVQERWQELTEDLSLVADLAGALDEDGFEIHPLHGQGARKLKTRAQVQQVMRHIKLKHGTQLCTRIRHVLAKRTATPGKKILLFIATDGEPKEESTEDGMVVNPYITFEHLLRDLSAQGVHMSVLLCTDNERVAQFYKGVDRRVARCDVTDDYVTEKATVDAEALARGQNPPPPFTPGDRIAKMLLGPILDTWDTLNVPEAPPPYAPVIHG